MTVISLPKILRERLTDEGADAFVQILDKVEERSQQTTLEIAEERFEKKLAQLDAKIDVRTAELRTEIAEVKAEIIRWMFIFWAGQVATTFAIVKFLK